MEIESILSERAQLDYALIRKALDTGDQKAYAELMGRYKESVYYMLLKMVYNPDYAEDLTMEAFGKAFKNLHLYTPQNAFSTWLFRIAINNSIDFIRRYKDKNLSISRNEDLGYYDDTSELKSNTYDPEEIIMERQMVKTLRELIEKLKPRYRTLIELRYFGDYSYEDIAQEMNLPLGTVKAQLNRAKEFLYNVLKGTDPKL